MHATFIRAAYLPLWGIYRVVRCALVFGLASTVFAAAFGQRLTWIGVPLGHGEARAVSADGRVIVGITWHSPARWVDGRYQPITIDPWGVSADGRIVVGRHQNQAAYWIDGERRILPTVEPGEWDCAYGISDDGRVIVGESGGRPVRWVEGVPERLAQERGAARGVSADGRIIAGTVNNRAVRWVDGQMEVLPDLPGVRGSTASCVSADGRVIAGWGWMGGSQQPTFVVVRWVDGQPEQIAVPWLTHGEVKGISGDGRVIVGHGRVRTQPGDPSYPRGAFIWREDGLTSLLILETNVWANGVSRDGRVVVGRYEYSPFRYMQGHVGLLETPNQFRPALPWDVSADGRVIVGNVATDNNDFFLVWRNGLAFPITFGITTAGQGRALSADGRVVVGQLVSSFGSSAVRWSQQGVDQLPLPGVYRSAAFGVSSDGSVVVGRAEIAQRGRFAFRWVGNDVTLLPDFGFGSTAVGVNADGRIIVGWASHGSVAYPVRWNDGTLERLLDASGLARRCSDDGQVVIGEYFDANDYRRAFRWHNGVWQDLGAFGKNSYAYDLTADGNAVVGGADDPRFPGWRAWRWRNGVMEDLNLVYANLLSPHSVLAYATGISPNGRYIVGYGWNSAAQSYTGFLLDTWRTGDVNGDGCVNDADLLAVLAAFGTPGSGDARHEDIDKDGIVSDADLLTVLFEFGSGC